MVGHCQSKGGTCTTKEGGREGGRERERGRGRGRGREGEGEGEGGREGGRERGHCYISSMNEGRYHTSSCSHSHHGQCRILRRVHQMESLSKQRVESWGRGGGKGEGGEGKVGR